MIRSPDGTHRYRGAETPGVEFSWAQVISADFRTYTQLFSREAYREMREKFQSLLARGVLCDEGNDALKDTASKKAAQEEVMEVLGLVGSHPNTMGSQLVLETFGDFLESLEVVEEGSHHINSEFLNKLIEWVVDFIVLHPDAFALTGIGQSGLWKRLIFHTGNATVLGEIATRLFERVGEQEEALGHTVFGRIAYAMVMVEDYMSQKGLMRWGKGNREFCTYVKGGLLSLRRLIYTVTIIYYYLEGGSSGRGLASPMYGR